MLLTQEPTFVMVVTQEPTTNIYIYKRGKKKRKISCYLCISHHGMIYCCKHHHAKPKLLCTVAWGHATHSIGGDVESQKYHILFIFHIPFVTLFLFYPFIKPLISTTLIIHMGLYYIFSNNLILSILSEFMVNY